MLSRNQIILLKRAQAQANIPDAEYRDAIERCSGMLGCRSAKDPRLTDRHLDKLLAYFEGIFWHQVDLSKLPEPDPFANIPFRLRGFWAARNTKAETSRDRYVQSSIQSKVQAAEAALIKLGFGFPYLAAIQNHIRPFSLIAYLAALNRTLKAKTKHETTP